MANENVVNWPQRLVRWTGAWLLVQTLLFGAVMWVISFNVLVRGASASYTPPETTEDFYIPPTQKHK